jgi:hypothetical protein
MFQTDWDRERTRGKNVILSRLDISMFVSNVKSGLSKQIESNIIRKYDLNQDLRARKK